MAAGPGPSSQWSRSAQRREWSSSAQHRGPDCGAMPGVARHRHRHRSCTSCPCRCPARRGGGAAEAPQEPCRRRSVCGAHPARRASSTRRVQCKLEARARPTVYAVRVEWVGGPHSSARRRSLSTPCQCTHKQAGRDGRTGRRSSQHRVLGGNMAGKPAYTGKSGQTSESVTRSTVSARRATDSALAKVPPPRDCLLALHDEPGQSESAPSHARTQVVVQQKSFLMLTCRRLP